MSGRPVMAALLSAMQPNTAYTAAGLAKTIGCRRIAAHQALVRMATKGRIGMRRVGGNAYFASQAMADEFGAQAAAVLADALRQQRVDKLRASNARAMGSIDRNRLPRQKPGRAAPVVIAEVPPEPKHAPRPVDMSQAVWTIATTPLDRFSVDPATVQPGSFVIDMPPGRWSDYAVRGAP